jgi:hypothetical protein
MVCPDPERAAASLTPILSGNLDGPGDIFGVGSNSEAPVGHRKRPRAIILSARLFTPFAMAVRAAANAVGAPAEQMRQMEPEESIDDIKGRLLEFVSNGRIGEY